MYRGYTIRWRKRWEKGYHKDHLLWTMMDWFIDHAASEKQEIYFPNYGTIELDRGQRVFGIHSLAAIFNTSAKRVRSRLKILEKIEFLEIKRTNKFSIGNVINYDFYQDSEKRKGKQKDKQRASRGQAEGKQRATNNTLEYISKELIIHLNEISGRNFKPESNIDYIIPRLKDGFTKEDCIKVIEKKWKDPDFNRKYFRPETLFRKSKFEGYLNEDIGIEPEQKSKSRVEYLKEKYPDRK